MISIAPLRRMLVERELSLKELSRLSGVKYYTLLCMQQGKAVTDGTIDALCRTLGCQPCDIIRYEKNGGEPEKG